MKHRVGWLAALLVAPLTVLGASEVLTVSQIGRDFSVKTLQIHHGDVVRFINKDVFLHQIYVNSPNFNFVSDEQEPGKTVDLAFPRTGVFGIMCQIHPKMLLTVTVD